MEASRESNIAFAILRTIVVFIICWTAFFLALRLVVMLGSCGTTEGYANFLGRTLSFNDDVAYKGFSAAVPIISGAMVFTIGNMLARYIPIRKTEIVVGIGLFASLFVAMLLIVLDDFVVLKFQGVFVISVMAALAMWPDFYPAVWRNEILEKDGR